MSNNTIGSSNLHPNVNVISVETQINSGSRVGSPDVSHDAIIISLEPIRRLPSVSDTVTGILASYDSQARQESVQVDTTITAQFLLHLNSDGQTRASTVLLVRKCCCMMTYQCPSG